jgi:ABC-type uncharacterized transport system permease subunit
MKNFFSQLFNDNNTINEKSVIGFLSFLVLVGFAVSDVITGYYGKDLVVNEFIFNAFVLITLGCFGISSVDKFINNKKEDSEQNEEELQ